MLTPQEGWWMSVSQHTFHLVIEIFRHGEMHQGVRFINSDGVKLFRLKSAVLTSTKNLTFGIAWRSPNVYLALNRDCLCNVKSQISTGKWKMLFLK